MRETAQLAEFAVEMKSADVPARSGGGPACWCFRPVPAARSPASRCPGASGIHDTIAPLTAPGGASVVQYRDQLAPDGAAFINSAFAHSNESDDTHLKTPTHPGAVIIPAAMAVAESLDLDGQALLDAVIVGYEVMLRVSYSVLTAPHHPGAPPAACGGPVRRGRGGVPADGPERRGDPERDGDRRQPQRRFAGIHADRRLGQAAALRDPGPGRRPLGPAGPQRRDRFPTVLEGERGFTKVFAPERNLDWLTRGLGSEWILMETAIKGYSCCHLIHPALDSIVGMRSTTEFEARTSRASRSTTSAALVKHVGVIVEPQDILGASSAWATRWPSCCTRLAAASGTSSTPTCRPGHARSVPPRVGHPGRRRPRPVRNRAGHQSEAEGRYRLWRSTPPTLNGEPECR